jgi:lipopolysaccharide/colanic/teichoic acid biosynthesis glycosyltransferase
MLGRYNRLLVAIHVVADTLSAAAAFAIAYVIRFETNLFATPKGQPPFERYLTILPFVALLVPAAFRLQGLYRLRRGRSRVDDFFAVLVGSIWAVLAGVAGTLFVQAYYVPPELKGIGYFEVSQPVWVLFLICTVALTYGSRLVVRDVLRRRWRAGKGLKRVLVVGAGDLGRMVADRILDHGDFGFLLTGFLDDRFGSDDLLGHRGLPVLGRVDETADVCAREHVDEIYVALPIEEHMKMLGVVEFAGRECINVHVVPDLLQIIALKARLEDLDGLPLIGVNDVPLRGLNAVAKRIVDVALSSAVLMAGAIPAAIISWLITRSSPGPVDVTGPIWARDDDPRATPIGRWLRRTDVDELPQFWNVLRGDMSIVGPRPERPFFVEQFKHRIPQYMLRHKVKAGITGWAQVNGWRGNTSLEKRIEFDLYYIENWSLGLDIKIMGLTLLRGFNRAA